MVKIIENYQLQEVIGEGQYGKVYKAKDTKNSLQVAIKVVPILKFKENRKLEECTINEIKMLSMLQKQEKNDHIVKFIELLKTQNNYYFVYDFCNGGTLEKYLSSQKFFQEQRALKVFVQILNAFRSLVQYNIMHRDLKPTNILLHDGVIKLADFGFCTSLKSKNDMTKTMLGSPIYMAPEILRGYEYCIKADIWSLGVVLYEMLYGYCPFEERTIARLISVQDFGKLKFCNSLNPVSEETKALIVKMLIQDPARRISWEELFKYQVTEEGNLFYDESQQPIQKLEEQKQKNVDEQLKIQKQTEMSRDPKQASNPAISPYIAQNLSYKNQESKQENQQDLMPLEIVKAQSQNQQNEYLKDDSQNKDAKDVKKQQKYRRESLNYTKTEQEFSSLKKIQQVDRKIGSGIQSPDKKSLIQIQLGEDSFKKNKVLQNLDKKNSSNANYSQTFKNLNFQAENKENKEETTPSNKYISKIPALNNTKFNSQQKKYEENPYKNLFRESLKQENESQKENLFFTMNNHSKLKIADNLPEPPKILQKKNQAKANNRSNTIHFDSSEQLSLESKNYNFGISLRDQGSSPKPFIVKQKQSQYQLPQNSKNLLIYFLARLLNQTIQNNLNNLTPQLAYYQYKFIETLIPQHNKQQEIEPLMGQLKDLFIKCNLPSLSQKFFTFQEKYCQLVVQYCQEVFKVKENRFNERIIIHMILVLQSVCLQDMNHKQGMSTLTDILESKEGFQGHLDNLLTLKISQLWKKYQVLMSNARKL